MQNIPPFAEYLRLIDQYPGSVHQTGVFAFLPIRFFKSHRITSEKEPFEAEFHSSSTGQSTVSRHFVKYLREYHDCTRNIFEDRFGALDQYRFYGLLPNYLEKGNSSLVNMVRFFMSASGQNEERFYLHDHEQLQAELIKPGKKVLFGVSFALLDYAEKYTLADKDLTIIETGGMKGRKKEITREELHTILRRSFPLSELSSEYGMTELFSQAYSDNEGLLMPPPWMKVLIRPDTDPLGVAASGKGALNIIDLANQRSCAFIATDDLGEVYPDGRFKILGRLDDADLRGCSLMI